MRLRLLINRNGLPPTKIWWDTASFQPGDDKTTSSLLARVSQIVPLESSKWGLEDYAVEIGGFEVLHFQEVGTVIREGDEVVIRPLSGMEIKQRRLSGRRQISTSGRKLIDGTPFGRGCLRPAPDRPNLAIPPRKRRKLGQTGVDDSVMAEAGSETDDSYNEEEGDGDGDWDEDEGDEDEDGSDINSEGSEEVSERRLIQMKDDRVGKNTSMLVAQGVLQGFGGKYNNPLLDYYHDKFRGRGSEADTLEKITKKSKSSTDGEYKEGKEERNISSDGKEEMQFVAENDSDFEIDTYNSSEDENLDPNQAEDSDSEGHNADVSVRGEELPATVSGHSTDSSDDSSDGDFDPRKGAPSAEGSKDENESNDTSSELSSNEESSTELEVESEEEEISELKMLVQNRSKQKATTPPHSPSSSSSSSFSSKFPKPQQPKVPKGPPVAPGTTPHQGNQSTKARNKRKSEQRKRKQLIKLGVLPEDTNRAGYVEYLAAKQTHELTGSVNGAAPHSQLTPSKEPQPEKRQEKPGKPTDSEPGMPMNRRKRRKKAFAKAKKNGTVPEGQDFEMWIEEREQKQNEGKGKGKGKDDKGDIISTGANCILGNHLPAADDAPTEESSKQRKVYGRHSVNSDVLKRTVPHDLAIGKKDQFGKRPKRTIYDNDGNPVSVDTGGFTEALIQPEDPDAWRGKLVLSAIECEWGGVKLPPPSFPFKQHIFHNLNEITGTKRKRAGNKQKQKQKDYQGNKNYTHNDNGYYQKQHQDDWSYDYYDDTTKPTNTNDQPTDTIMEEPESIDDLPPLPENVSSLSPLTKPVLQHTVIAFKQLTMDANYTPILADYRTAIVDEVDDQVQDGPFLILKLALRDRLKRNVDKETGEKLLRKFEMPGNTDDDEGRIELMFGELLEPKVVKLPEIVETSGTQDEKVYGDNDSEGGVDGAVDGTDPEESMNVGPPKKHDYKPPDERYHNTPAPKQIENAVGFTGAVDSEAVPELETLSGGFIPHIALSVDEPMAEELQRNTDPTTDIPVVSQVARTSSKYSQELRGSKSSEPEPHSKMYKDDCQNPINNDEGEGSTFRRLYESDSDDLPTLESILASQSQRVSVKLESSQADGEPQLSPLSQFSPFGMNVSDAERSPGKSLDEQQIQKEVEVARKTKPGRGRPKKTRGSSQVQLIDLTGVSSDSSIEDDPKRGRGRGRPRGKRVRRSQ